MSIHKPLRERIESQGAWLFRWRSSLPLLMLPLLALGFSQYRYPGGAEGLDLLWELFCLSVSLVGLALRFYVNGTTPRRTSGRNTRKGQVADSLNVTGAYSVVRHPLYLANFLVALGFVLFFFLWWLPVVYAFLFWLYYERIMFAEEEFLRRQFGASFTAWAERTPAFLPSFGHWRAPALSFSWRSALKSEYQTVFQAVAVFTLFEVVSDAVCLRHFHLDRLWLTLFVAGVVLFIMLRIIRKHTRILHAVGR